MTIFWDVDTQVDFLDPAGRLYVPGAEAILPNLARLTAHVAEAGFPLISSVCAHVPGDPELVTYGSHCMVGTPGQQKASETLLPIRCVIPNRLVALPDVRAFQQVIVEKQDFDVFTNPNTEELLRQFRPPLRIVLYGVVTEICVAAAARRFLERGYQVAVVGDAVRALDKTRAAAFIEELVQRGGEVITTDDAVIEPPASRHGAATASPRRVH
jgi:nicotinamidase/pyrazinamidase